MAANVRSHLRDQAIAVCIVGFACASISCSSENDDAQVMRGDLVRYSVSVSNSTSRVLPKARLWLDAPLAEAADQKVLGLKVDHPHRVLTDGNGAQRIYFEFSDVPVSFTGIVEVQVSVEFGTQAVNSASGVAQHYLGPQRLIPTDAMEIREIATALPRSSAQGTVDAALDWLRALEADISDSVDEPEDLGGAMPDEAIGDAPPTVPGALVLLKERRGSSADQVHLVAAVLRAAEIPARAVLGYADDGDGHLTADELRYWVEYAVEGTWKHVLLAPESVAETGRLVAIRLTGDSPGDLPGSKFVMLHEAVGLDVSLVP